MEMMRKRMLQPVEEGCTVHESVGFSMIAAAGSKVDFHSRFDDDSRERWGVGQQPPMELAVERQSAEKAPQERLEKPQQAVLSKAKSGKHGRNIRAQVTQILTEIESANHQGEELPVRKQPPAAQGSNFTHK
jgi:hypothetical protein